MESTQSLSFKVARKPPELIAPAKPTPHELKVLSDVDDQGGLRITIPTLQIYRVNLSVEAKDPVEVLRDAIAKALVFYYPFAGRLRENSGGKLVVECTGEGVLFIEADADVTLQQFGDAFYPPFPCKEELLYDEPAAAGFLHSPILLIQVTRLKCGGFIFAIRNNHAMTDAVGVVQFMSAVGDLARGAETPAILPIWERHLLITRQAQRVTSTHAQGASTPTQDHHRMVHRSFLFGAAEFSALRSLLPLHLRVCSDFELLTACLWRSRTIAVSKKPDEEARMLFAVNIRNICNPPLPKGYYGNAITLPPAVSTAGELSRNPLHYALELVRKSKMEVIEELKKSSSVDGLVIRCHQNLLVAETHAVTDLTQIGFENVDFGWGKPVYGGPMEDSMFWTFYIPIKDSKGEIGKLVPVCLAEDAMEVFVSELERMMFKGGEETVAAGRESTFFINPAL